MLTQRRSVLQDINEELNACGDVAAGLGLVNDLSGYGDKYLVTDLRKRSKKEPGDVKSLSTKNLEIKLSEKAPKNYVGPLEVKTIETEHLKVDFYFDEKGNYYYSDYPRGYFFYREKERVYNTNDYCINSDDSISYRKQIIIPYSRFFDNAKNDNFIIKFKVASKNYVNWKVSGSSVTCYVPVSDIATPYLAELNYIISNTSKNSYNGKVAVILKKEVLEICKKLGINKLEEKELDSSKPTSPITLFVNSPFTLDTFPAKVHTEIMGSDGEKTVYVSIPTTVQKGDLHDISYEKPRSHTKQFGFDYEVRARVTPETWRRLKIDAAYNYGKTQDANMKKIINSYIAEVFTRRVGKEGAFKLEDYQLGDLGKPTIKFEFENNDELKKFLSENKENLIESYIDVTPDDEADPSREKLTGVQLPAELFNVPEHELKCGGMKATYKRLPDYSHLIDTAENTQVFRGYGFSKTTLTELRECVANNWRQVQKLADHLKADSEKQSAFNLWHWLHTNIKYNYDTAGLEEIRTPARTWADRARGVDCDCLSVFSYCVLHAMGYKPKFEIVALNHAAKYSHIYINLNGLAVDRVLPCFGARPLFITKKILMEVPVYELRGCGLRGLDGLKGLYESTLKKVRSGTATPAEKLDFKKAKIMVSLANTDYNGYRLAGLLMPHVVDIDEHGAYYFENPEIARIAAEGENSILQAERRGASEDELNGLFKKIGNAIKKATTAVAKVVAAPVKAAVKVTETAVKATTNAVKATANVVKAGVQAATGNTAAAKETLQKAGTQAKAATVTAIKDTVKDGIVEPTKTTVKETGTIIKETVINPTVATVKIAGKVFKVLLIKINPITVLMRNALRALVAINFIGFATRLNVGSLTEEEALEQGYEKAEWEKAQKGYKRVVSFFTKMGGKRENIEKTIHKGATRKPLFKKDYTNDTKVNITDDDATLGEGVTIGSCLAAVGAFFVKIWNWIKNVVPKAVNWIKEHKEAVETVKNVAETVLTKKDGETTTTEEMTTTTTTTAESNGPNIWVLVAAAAGVALLFSGGKKKGKKNKKK